MWGSRSIHALYGVIRKFIVFHSVSRPVESISAQFVNGQDSVRIFHFAIEANLMNATWSFVVSNPSFAKFLCFILGVAAPFAYQLHNSHEFEANVFFSISRI